MKTGKYTLSCFPVFLQRKATMLLQNIPPTKDGALLAVLIATIEQESPSLRVDGILASHDRLYIACFDQRHRILVGFATESDWRTYLSLIGTATGKETSTHA
jgi:hypothetical protein